MFTRILMSLVKNTSVFTPKKTAMSFINYGKKVATKVFTNLFHFSIILEWEKKLNIILNVIIKIVKPKIADYS